MSGFRTDIEGLRGVAVLLVVLAHAGVPGLAAGFIGVDVFFVISGYLITGLLVGEYRRNGRIDLWRFYARRARRLAPAALTALVAVSLLAWWLLPPGLFAFQAESGAWAAAWASNLYFAFAGFDYFDSGSAGSLWLHTWSLGVEEQFYLLWPAVLLICLRGRVRVAVAAITVTGFLACVLVTPVEASLAYYLMPLRLWQLTLGGLLVLCLDRHRVSARASAALGLAGVALLVVALAVAGRVAYPGAWAALAALAAVALIAAGSNAGGLIPRLLSLPVLRFPGRISYSWYLWHWPLLVLWPLLGVDVTPPLRAGAVLLSLLAAWASWRWIEQPFRRSADARARPIVLATVLGSLLLAAVLAFSARQAAIAGEAGLDAEVAAMDTGLALYADPHCDQWYQSADLVPCPVIGSGAGAERIVLIGDSIGAQWTPALEAHARARGAELVVLTKSACAIVDESYVYDRIRRRYRECEQWREAAIAWITEQRPSLVLVGSSAGYPFSREQWVEGSRRLLRPLAEVAPVVVLAPTPVLRRHGLNCARANARRHGSSIVVDGCTEALDAVAAKSVTGALAEAAAGVPGVQLLDLGDLVCPDGVCAAFRDGRLVFRDQVHLTPGAVEAMAEEFSRRLDAVTAASPP